MSRSQKAAAAPEPQTASPAPAEAAPLPASPQEPDTSGAATASAAAPAAPGDPTLQAEAGHAAPEGDPKPADLVMGRDGLGVIVKGPAKGRWRIGRHFGPEPVTIPLNELTQAQMAALSADPELTCVGIELTD